MKVDNAPNVGFWRISSITRRGGQFRYSSGIKHREDGSGRMLGLASIPAWPNRAA